MNLVEFKDLAQGIQAILLACGLLIAGVWAIYRFRSLLSVQKAKADLDKVNAELDKSRVERQKLQQELTERPYLSIGIEPFLIGTPNSGEFYLKLRMQLSNFGAKPDLIDWN